MSGVAKKLMSAAGAAEVAWDLSYAYYDPPEGLSWNVSTAFLRGSRAISGEEINPTGLFFKPDGLKMYLVGTTGDDVNEYNLSTAWDISTETFVQSFSVAAQEVTPEDLFFKPDGLKMYIIGSAGDDVNEYELSTAWDVSSASFLQSFSVATEETVPTGLFFKPDGLKMYVLGAAGDDVNEYNLSTAWDISTASYLQNFSVAAQDAAPNGVFFKPNGLKMYVVGQSSDAVSEYDLSTAWDVSSASFLQSFSVAAQDITPQAIFFKPDGTAMYMVGQENDTIYRYILGGFDVSAQEVTPESVFFKPDGLKMYVLGSTGDDVNEYDLSTAWDLSTASFLQRSSVSAQENEPYGLFFKPDGTKMYVIGATGDDVNEYDLSTAWDISTETFVQSFSVAAQQTLPTGLFFRGDGLKMYTIGDAPDSVHEYNLSIAWDVSSASYLQARFVGAEASSPEDLFFKPDGRKMYVVNSNTAHEYNLSTAWDISTETFVQSFDVGVQENQPVGVFFGDDGLQMFIVGPQNDRVYAYTLGVQE